MITKQNIAQLFAVIIITTTLSISTPVYAEKKLKTTHTVAKVLHNCAAGLGGGAASAFFTYCLLGGFRTNGVGEKAIYCAIMYLGSTLAYNAYHNLKALKNSIEQADVIAPASDAQPAVDSKTVDAS